MCEYVCRSFAVSLQAPETKQAVAKPEKKRREVRKRKRHPALTGGGWKTPLPALTGLTLSPGDRRGLSAPALRTRIGRWHSVRWMLSHAVLPDGTHRDLAVHLGISTCLLRLLQGPRLSESVGG